MRAEQPNTGNLGTNPGQKSGALPCNSARLGLLVQSAWLVNYAERHRAGLRVGTSITEGTANFLVNRRMNKSQQMRWSRRGADLLLQVRCAGFNGKLGSSFGQLFQAVDPASELAMAT
jgi:hypothetical protein